MNISTINTVQNSFSQSAAQRKTIKAEEDRNRRRTNFFK